VSLKRVSSQGTLPLQDFYREFAESDDGVSSSIGTLMLELLPMLNEMWASAEVWGLTSLADLWLLSADDWTSRWHVCVTGHPGGGFRIRYRRPDGAVPWPDALVDGHARDVAHACQLLAIAMRESGGWSFPRANRN
jgi:hypothetical protein